MVKKNRFSDKKNENKFVNVPLSIAIGILIFITSIVILPIKETFTCNNQKCKYERFHAFSGHYIQNLSRPASMTIDASFGRRGAMYYLRASNYEFAFNNPYSSYQAAENDKILIESNATNIKIKRYNSMMIPFIVLVIMPIIFAIFFIKIKTKERRL